MTFAAKKLKYLNVARMVRLLTMLVVSASLREQEVERIQQLQF